jgi:hypothetical protein
MGDLFLFIPITKVDATRRLVYGVATAEVEDRAGEICDYVSTKPHYEKWSDEIAQSTSGKSFGNLRSMHGPVAAGKITAITFNDDAKQIEICAKVVDDSEWVKVTEGVYTGFSQGGSYERRWTDENGRTRYTAVPNEISLVDMPCLPQARFELIKADGTHEMHAFEQRPSLAARLEDLLGELAWLENLSSAELVEVPDLADVVDDLHELSACLTGALRSLQPDKEDSFPRAHRGSRMGVDLTDRLGETGESTMPRYIDRARQQRQSRGRRGQRWHEATDRQLDADRSVKKAIRWGLEKQFDTISTTLADVLQRVKNIEQQPLPLPLAGQRRVVAKHEDGALDLSSTGSVDALLADPEALSILAIRLAQQNGRSRLR